MVAVRPTFHNPAIFAKQAACLDQISGGRVALNVVSSWWADEARRYGVRFDAHDDRYARTAEWLAVLDGAWRGRSFTLHGAALSGRGPDRRRRGRCDPAADALRGRRVGGGEAP
jgi:alkanesulfonate monooxygenase SsuD/methylene tetrahydromethanopterin reductase-like flavin-dependent oxidoreductase (luciferase family)